MIFLGEKEVSQTKIDAIVKGYHCIEKFLESSKYVAGNNLTLADLSLWPLIESSMQIIPVDAETFPKFNEWLDRLRQLPYYDELNKKGADPHVQAYRDFLVKNNV